MPPAFFSDQPFATPPVSPKSSNLSPPHPIPPPPPLSQNSKIANDALELGRPWHYE